MTTARLLEVGGVLRVIPLVAPRGRVQLVRVVVAGLGDRFERPAERVLIIPVTSDRGLCGGYNSYVIKLARETISQIPELRT